MGQVLLPNLCCSEQNLGSKSHGGKGFSEAGPGGGSAGGTRRASVCPATWTSLRVPDLHRRAFPSDSATSQQATHFVFVPGALGSQHARVRSHLLPAVHRERYGE